MMYIRFAENDDKVDLTLLNEKLEEVTDEPCNTSDFFTITLFTLLENDTGFLEYVFKAMEKIVSSIPGAQEEDK